MASNRPIAGKSLGSRYDAASTQRVALGSTGIATQLRRAILAGDYGYRERLPSERELAERFAAARGTVRAALQQLEDMHLVTRRAGSGTFVRYRRHADHEDVAELTSPLELIEVRLAVEPAMARLAVMHANAQDLENMAEALALVEDSGSDAELFSKCDEGFHLALAESTRNPLMVWLYRQINEVREHAQWSARKDKILTPKRIAGYNVQHRELYLAIVSRDIDAAVSTMVNHLENARGDLLGAS